MNLITFLSWVASPIGCGAAVFATIEALDNVWPHGLTSNQKFYFAFGLAFAWPLAAYATQVALGVAVLDPNALFEAVAVGYMVSQLAHRTASLQSAAGPGPAPLSSTITASPLLLPYVQTAPSSGTISFTASTGAAGVTLTPKPAPITKPLGPAA